MNQRLYVFSLGPADGSALALDKLARFLGLETALVPIREDCSECPGILPSTPPDGLTLAVSRATVQLLKERSWFARLLHEARFVFVYGFPAGSSDSPELAWLSGGVLPTLTQIDAGSAEVEVRSDVTFNQFPVSGQRYQVESAAMAAFSLPSQSSAESYLTVNGRPVFISLRRGEARLFILSAPSLVDIDVEVSPADSLRRWYIELISATIFLRSALGRWCWRAPRPVANFILDDPSLQARYGFVRYDRLLPEVQRLGGALTVAFIPYNYRRSQPAVIQLISRHRERFSIAVHGCDHTGGEFAASDEDWLSRTTGCALERMDQHSQSTQLPYDKVMVFPQGKFSTHAMTVLQDHHFIAAVNSGPWPMDLENPTLKLRDLLDVAVTRFSGFPLFLRRYPDAVFDLAFDALFQKPVLVVEHHGFFKPGLRPLEEVLRALNTFTPKLQWLTLGAALASSYLIRPLDDLRFELKCCTPILRIENPTPGQDCTILLQKPERAAAVAQVLWGGAEVRFEIRSGILRCELLLCAGETKEFKILYPPRPIPRRRASMKYRSNVFARRLLSDWRDNYLAKSDWLLSAAERTKRLLERRPGRAAMRD